MGMVAEVGLKKVATWATENLIKCMGVACSFQVFFNCIYSWAPASINIQVFGFIMYDLLQNCLIGGNWVQKNNLFWLIYYSTQRLVCDQESPVCNKHSGL